MIPETNRRADWPRLVKLALDKLNGRTRGLDKLASRNFANDAAAAAGGVPVGEFYRNGSVVMVRVA